MLSSELFEELLGADSDLLLPPLLLLAGAADVEREDEDDLALDCCLGSDLGADDLGAAVDEDLLGAEEDLASLLLGCAGELDEEGRAVELLGVDTLPEGLAAELLDSVEAGLAVVLLVEGADDLAAGPLSSEDGRVTVPLVAGRVPVLLPWLDSLDGLAVPVLELPVDLLAAAAFPVVVRVVVLPDAASVLLEAPDLSAEVADLRELLVAVLRLELRLERVCVYILSPSLLVSGLE